MRSQEGVIGAPGPLALQRRPPCRLLKEFQEERHSWGEDKCAKAWQWAPAPAAPGAVGVV